MPVLGIIHHRHSPKEFKTCYKCQHNSKNVKDFTTSNGLSVCWNCFMKRKYGMYKYMTWLKTRSVQFLQQSSRQHYLFNNQSFSGSGMKRAITSNNDKEKIDLKSSTSDSTNVNNSAANLFKIKAVILAILAIVGPAIIFNDLIVLMDSEMNADDKLNENNLWRKWHEPDSNILRNYFTDICSIDKVCADEITEQEFKSKYKHKKPVIIQFKNGASDWTNITKWMPSHLIQDYGSQTLYSGKPREIVRHGGNGDTKTTLEYYIKELMTLYKKIKEPYLYVFDRLFYKGSELEIFPPSYLDMKDGVDDSMFFLGTSRSGVSFHKHAEGWNAIVFGQKRWFLYPKTKMPPGGMYPGYSQLDWFHHIYPNLTDASKPIECIQHDGEMIYLPESMYHSTINLGDTIAVGIQKIQAVSEEEKLFYKDNQYERQNQPNKRLSVLKKLQQLLPDNGEVYSKLGIVYEQLLDLKSAEHHYAQAIQLDPFFLVAILNMARTKSKLNQKVIADSMFRHVISLNPNMWDVYAEYGMFLIEEKKFEDAIKMFQKGCELQPTMRPFWDYLRYCQESVGDWDGANYSKEQISKLDGQ